MERLGRLEIKSKCFFFAPLYPIYHYYRRIEYYILYRSRDYKFYYYCYFINRHDYICGNKLANNWRITYLWIVHDPCKSLKPFYFFIIKKFEEDKNTFKGSENMRNIVVVENIIFLPLLNPNILFFKGNAYLFWIWFSKVGLNNETILLCCMYDVRIVFTYMEIIVHHNGRFHSQSETHWNHFDPIAKSNLKPSIGHQNKKIKHF